MAEGRGIERGDGTEDWFGHPLRAGDHKGSPLRRAFISLGEGRGQNLLSIETHIQIHLLRYAAEKISQALFVFRSSASSINSAFSYSSLEVSLAIGTQIDGYSFDDVAFGIVTLDRVTGRNLDAATAARRDDRAVVGIGDFRLCGHQYQGF